MKNAILSALDGVYLACIWIAGMSIFVMSIIIPIGVFARYVLGFGAQWPEPIAILLMVIFTFVGAAAAYRAGAHIAVAMLTDRLPANVRAACRWLVHLLMLVVSLFMIVYGTKLCLETMGQTITSLPWMPVGATYAPVPIGGLLTLFFVLENLVFGTQHDRAVVVFDHVTDTAEA
ncbi:MAG: TRAP transporter small permease [Rhodoferax sp.]|nr:TRAP transporter small permease [Rhodoferax sp.]MCB2041779.1 TRAP transporter small permease [Rhodoferax sp.]MCP5264047.1 TRAP transporter small permease [Rhodoferax sp.]